MHKLTCLSMSPELIDESLFINATKAFPFQVNEVLTMLFLTACTGGDTADWCSRMPKGDCYVSEKTCCDTCTRHWTNVKGTVLITLS